LIIRLTQADVVTGEEHCKIGRRNVVRCHVKSVQKSVTSCRVSGPWNSQAMMCSYYPTLADDLEIKLLLVYVSCNYHLVGVQTQESLYCQLKTSRQPWYQKSIGFWILLALEHLLDWRVKVHTGDYHRWHRKILNTVQRNTKVSNDIS
jgi:hypothetical protein